MMEYLILRLDYIFVTDGEAQMNAMAKKGWRVIAVTMRHDGVETAYLERPVAKHASP